MYTMTVFYGYVVVSVFRCLIFGRCSRFVFGAMTVFVLPPPGICAVFTVFVGCTMTMFLGWLSVFGAGRQWLALCVCILRVYNGCFCVSTCMLWWCIQWLFVWCLCFVG